nr:hypothetical protein [Oryza sativa Japonica Group]
MTSTGSKGAGQGMKGTREELLSSDSDDWAASLACGRPVDWSLAACLLLEGSLVPRRGRLAAQGACRWRLPSRAGGARVTAWRS